MFSHRAKILALSSLLAFSVTIALLGRFVLNHQPDLTQPLTNTVKSDTAASKEKPKIYDEHYGVNTEGTLTPELIEIPAGSFLMGSVADEGSPAEHPQHKISIDKFWISRFEITNAQYLSYCLATKHAPLTDPHWRGIYMRDYPDHPVVNVTWKDAKDYCQWLSTIVGKEVRLPTEAEWEYAAQGSAPGTTLLESSSEIMPTTKVGSHAANQFGLYDMLGNVWEWCEDYYDVGYYPDSPPSNPRGPGSGDFHTLRGGSWADNPTACRVSNRSRGVPDGISPTTGFRVVAAAR